MNVPDVLMFCRYFKT